MKTRIPKAAIGWWALLVAGLVWSPQAAWAGQVPAQDVGLITQLTGQVSCKGSQTKKGLPASAFMKIRLGDRLELEEAASLKLVFFSSGRQETWSGPVVIRVEAKAGRATSKAKPQVHQIPAQASQEVRQIPEILQRRLTMTRPGSLTHRGAALAQEPKAVVAPSQSDLEEIASATKRYEEMRASLPDDDITPELTLIGLLDVLEQYDRALEVAEQAQKRQPDNPQVKELVRVLSLSAHQNTPPAQGP